MNRSGIARQLKILQQQVDELSETHVQLRPDELFTAWLLKAYLTSDDAIALSSLTARQGEKGVDAVFVDARARVAFLVQTKYRLRGYMRAEPRSDILAFTGLPQQLLDANDKAFADFLKKVPPNAADRMRQVRRVVLRDGYRLHLLYATLGSCSKGLLGDAKRAAKHPVDTTSFEVLDGRRLLLLLKDYLDGAAPPIPILDLPLERGQGVQVNGVLQRYDQTNELESWVVSIRGDSVAELFELGGPRLFARNIRGFLGDNTPVNVGMQATLSKEPDHFFYYNNGITMVCDGAERVSHKGQDILRVSNPQVINGQQTTRMLATDPSRSAKASVLAKVIQVPRGVDHDDRFDALVSRIVQATNWQNAIRPSDLMANDRIQVDLEKALRKHGYSYLRKRQTKGEARKLAAGLRLPMITKEELAQAVAGCDLDPVIARSGKDNLFTEEHYDDVFPSTDALYYLPRYSLAMAVTSGARGYPQRGYMKWLVLGFLWEHIAPHVRSAGAATAFTTLWKRARHELVTPLSRAVNVSYKAAGRYYRANKGKGETVLDVSLFFRSKKGRDNEFRRYWRRCPASMRSQLSTNLKAVVRSIVESAS